MPVLHSAQPTHPSITNQTSPHYAEALVTEGRATTVDLHPFRLGRFAGGEPIVGDEYRLPAAFGHKL